MSKAIHNVTLDVLNPGWPKRIKLTELDSGHQILFHIAGMNLEGYTATIWIEKPSGLRVWNDCAVNGQTVIVDITNQMLAERGICNGQIKLHSISDGLVTPCDFIFDVKRDISGDGLESKNESTVLVRMIAEAVDIYFEKNPGGGSDGIAEELDPTVPDWAKQQNKPKYTAEEVGARPDTWTPSASEVGADTRGTAQAKVTDHNTSDTSHSDIRLLIEGLAARLNTVANSDDVTLDQTKEIVEYIKNNKNLIDGITTGKVSTSDIVDNLTTSVSNKPLSAKQGVILKALIEKITVPTLLSQLGGDADHRTVTDAEKAIWNAKSNFSGKYMDLTGRPTIPTKTSQLTNDSNYVTKDVTDQLSGQIADQQTELDGKQPKGNYALKSEIPTKTSQLQNDSNFVTESEFGSLEDKVESDAYKESVAQKVPYVKVAEHPICVNSIAEMTDTSKMYVLNEDGMYYAYMRKEVTTEGETVPNFTNLMDDPNAYAKKGYRYSHSGGAFKEQASDCAIVVPIQKTTSLVLRTRGGNYVNCAYPTSAYLGTSNEVFPTTTAATPTNGTSSNGDTYLNLTLPSSADYKYVVFHISSNVDLDTLIVTANEEITYTTTEGGTTIVEEWVNTGISYNQPANYESRVIANEQNIADLKNKTASLEKRVDSIGTGSSINSSGTTVFSTPAYAPVPQLPADGSEGSDFNIKSVTTQNAYDYMDALANKYTGYITKQTMGKDASGSFDHNRYILTKAYYRAWQRENYPKMFAWKNGNTVIYSVSVSPRVGDNMYSTPYVGTVYKAVTSVNCTAGTLSTRTVNGLVFTRYIDGDIEPTIVYTNVPMTPPGYFKTAPVYDSAYNQTTNVSSVGDGYFVGKNGITYKRYPFEDRKADKTKPLSIFILANEHGLHGDALIPSFVAMRMAKDLCKNTENPFLKWLKENCMITMIPVGNPWGYGRYLVNNSSGYYNSNGININRNYDTPGWATSDTNYGDVETFGEYAGSEIETQHIMNTMQLCKPAVGISMHGLGYPTEYRGLTDNGYFIYQGQGFSTSRMYKVAETLYTAYGLSRGPDTDYAEHYENCGKSPAYIQYVGAVGGLTETICWEAGTENEYTPIAMEQAYTQLLLFLQTWCEEALEKMS